MASPRHHSKTTRKTRIVCISDTHSASPDDGAFKLPKGDVLIHAGDLTNQGSLSELKKTLQWIERADFEIKIVIAGNHDVTLDKNFYEEYGSHFQNQYRQDPAQCLDLIKSSSIVYLHHSSAVIRLGSPAGPHTTFTVFGSPYVPARGTWAFGYDQRSESTASLWNEISLNTDIVITHTPAYNHCDLSPKWGLAGCEELRKALWRVRPRLAVCGHVHEGRGVERVEWKLDLPYTPHSETKTEVWEDPGAGNKKMSLVDLTGKMSRTLKNDGARAKQVIDNYVSFTSTGGQNAEIVSKLGPVSTTNKGAVSILPHELEISPRSEERLSRLHQHNTAALTGRLGRKETCIVNAAIMARSWGDGPKRFNKPIIVDLDLPVWDEEDSIHVIHRSSSLPAETMTLQLSHITPSSSQGSMTTSTVSESNCTSTDDSSSSSTSNEESIRTHYWRS